MESETSRDIEKPLDNPILPGAIRVLQGEHTTEARRGFVVWSGLDTILRMPDHREIIQVREQADESENAT